MTAQWNGLSGAAFHGEMHHYQEGNGSLVSSPPAFAAPRAKERAPMMPPWAQQARANPAPPPSAFSHAPGFAQPAADGIGGLNKGVVVPPPAKATTITTTTTTTTITTSTLQAQPMNRRFPLEEYRRRLLKIYAVHKADNVPKVDYLLEKYLGHEEYLYQSVCTKYSIDPESGLDKPAFSKAKPKAPPVAPSPSDVGSFQFGESPGGGEADVAPPPKAKAMCHEVEEWDPATGQTVVTTVELDEALLEALPELRASLQAVTPPKPAPVASGDSKPDFAMNVAAPMTPMTPMTPLPLQPSARSPLEGNRFASVPSPARPPPQDEDEYDPFSTEPNQGPPVRNPREAIAEIDHLLVGEATSFFEAWQRQQPTPLAMTPSILEPVPVLMEIPPLSSTEAEVSSAPWSASRRRRRFEVEPPGGAVQSPVAPSSTSGGRSAPPVPVAAYEAALLSQSVAVPTLFEIRPPALKPQSLGIVDLLDSDDEIPASSSSAPATTAPPSANAMAGPASSDSRGGLNPSANATAAPGALAQPVQPVQASMPMDVVELEDSDHEADPNHRPQKLPRSFPPAEALAPDMEDGSADAHIDPYLLMASTEDTTETAVREARDSAREALVEQLVEEAEAEAEAEEEIAQESAINAATETYVGSDQVDDAVKMTEDVNQAASETCASGIEVGEAVKMTDEVNEAGKDSSSEYTSGTDSSEEDGEDKTALAALAAVAQAAEQRSQPAFQ